VQTTAVTRVPRDGGYELFNVDHDFTYDTNDRTTSQTLSFGGPPLVSSADWAIGPEGGWSRTLTYPDGTVVEAERDVAGRVSTLRRDGGARTVDLQWLGRIRTGSDLYWRADADPLRERSTHDGLGKRLTWSWGLVDTDPSGTPVDPVWAAEYCGGEWDSARCDRGLLDIDARRDVTGRLRSVTTRWAHPFDADGDGALDPAPQPRWQGFDYDLRRRLSSRWSQTVAEADLPDLASHLADGPSVVAAAEDLDAERATFTREAGVGSLRSVERDGAVPWTDAVRGVGHRLSTVRIAGQVLDLTHDQGGRVVQIDPGFGLVYDPLDRLVAATGEDGELLEGYIYDADGRLVATVTPEGVVTALPHDGPQMLGAYILDDDGGWAPQWSAVWGPATDELIEWRDHLDARDYAPLADQRRSIVAAVPLEGAAAVSATAEYEAHGRLALKRHDGALGCNEQDTHDTVCEGPEGIPFGFASAWRSAVTGLTHMRNRWYSTRLGQFVSHDPLGFVDAFDLYGYAGFDPINRWDPSGRGSRGTAKMDKKSTKNAEKRPGPPGRDVRYAQTPAPPLPPGVVPPPRRPPPPAPPRVTPPPPKVTPPPPRVTPPRFGPGRLVKTIWEMCLRAPWLCWLAPVAILQGDTPPPVVKAEPDDRSDDLVPGDWVDDLDDLFERDEDGQPIEWEIEDTDPTTNPRLREKGVRWRWYIRDQNGNKWSIDVGPGPRFRYPPHKSTYQ